MNENYNNYPVAGVIALVFAILSFIPFIGVICIPISLILGGLSLISRNNGMAISTLVIGLIKLFITPALWITSLADTNISLFSLCIILLVVNIILIAKNNIVNKNVN